MLEAILAWLGIGGTFLAYVLLSRGRVASHSNVYLALNAVGGILGGVASLLYGAWPSAASNFLWAAFSLQPAIWSLARSASPKQEGTKSLGGAQDEGLRFETVPGFPKSSTPSFMDFAAAQGKPE